MERTERDFYARDKEDQEAFLNQIMNHITLGINIVTLNEVIKKVYEK